MGQKEMTVGVLGGMGPDATVDFMARVIALTPAREDQEHVRMLIDHNPRVPSRQAALAGEGESPGPVLAAMAARLEACGADFLVMPCNTAFAYRDDILAATTLPLLDIVRETTVAVLEQAPGARKVGVMATRGCLAAGLYQEGLARAGLEAVLPTGTETDRLMASIARIKNGARDGEAAVMQELAGALAGRGAEAVIVGCTEIPLVLGAGGVHVPLVSSSDALAAKTVALARGGAPLPARRR